MKVYVITVYDYDFNNMFLGKVVADYKKAKDICNAKNKRNYHEQWEYKEMELE